MSRLASQAVSAGVLIWILGCGGGSKGPMTTTGGQLPFPVILSTVPSEHAKIGQVWAYNFKIDTDPPGGYVEKRFDIANGVQGVVPDLPNNKITFTPINGTPIGSPIRIGWLFAANPSATLTQEVFVVVDP